MAKVPAKTAERAEIYRETGVDTAEADAGLRHIVERVQATWPAAGFGRVVLLQARHLRGRLTGLRPIGAPAVAPGPPFSPMLQESKPLAFCRLRDRICSQT